MLLLICKWKFNLFHELSCLSVLITDLDLSQSSSINFENREFPSAAGLAQNRSSLVTDLVVQFTASDPTITQ